MGHVYRVGWDERGVVRNLHYSAALDTTRTKSRRVIRRLTDNSAPDCSKMAGSRSHRDKFPRLYGRLYRDGPSLHPY